MASVIVLSSAWGGRGRASRPLAASLLHMLVFMVVTHVVYSLSFTRHAYNATIPENSGGMTYVIPDEKMGIFISDSTLQIKYKIVGGDNEKYFKAESRTVGDFCFLLIRTHTGNLNPLNRERKEFYHLQIKATTKSKGRQQLTLRAKAEVRVRVLDTNDLNPIFDPYVYKVEIPEDFPLHKNFLKVNATDADIGVNGEVYYSFVEPNENFAVHPTSGEISLTRPLDFHKNKEFELKLEAQDRGPKRSGHFFSAVTCHVYVEVRQVNLHDPIIRERHLPSVVEDSNVDIYAIIKVIDEDEGVHGEVSKIEIIKGDPDGHFRIQPGKQQNEYNIAVLNYLDREVAPYGYNLTLKVTDKGVPPRSSTKDIWVRVSDLNDHAPQFSQIEYRTQIEEIAPINTPVIRVIAHDTDVGRNAQITYKITAGNDDNTFVIHPVTGLILTAGPLDAEEQTQYDLTVTATDQANSGMRKSNSTRVIITVVDNNDEDPLFVKTHTDILINENEPAGSLVYTAKALDNDQGENGYVSYTIANLSPTPFTIDHFTGEIRTKELIDYETMRRIYVLKIRASDWGTVYRRQTEMSLRIVVQNVNDNRPQFEKVDCSGYLSRKTPIRTEILTVYAVDFDSDVISYIPVSGNEDKCFELDSKTGVIRVGCSLEDVRGKERFLNVTASDGQNFADTLAIKITIVSGSRYLGGNLSNFECRDSGVIQQFKEIMKMAEKNNQREKDDVLPQLPNRFGLNRHKPEFESRMPSRVAVNESTPVGSVILAVKAADKDLGYNGQLIYVISGGDLDSCFQVDMHSGILSVFSPLDRERRPRYSLNISVYDLGKPQKSSWRLLDIDLIDANDNPPVFTTSSFLVNVVEDAPNKTVIAKVQATDKDIGINAAISYKLITNTNDFAVNSKTGSVTVNNHLDRERQDTYELKILASDGSPDKPLSSTAIVRVHILDVNDNPPHFPLSQYVVRIREDVPKGTVVIPLSASDPDLNNGGRVEYSIVSGDDENVFVIDKEYGTIRLGNQLDFESKQIYNLSVSARDKGSPSLSTVTNLVVEVMDVNENQHAPKFGDFFAQGSVKENLPVGTFVMHVNATDDDEVLFRHNGKIIYSIRDGNGMGHFFIDKEGNIYTSDILDRETTQSYWLTVYAQDRGTIPLFSRLEVYIEVIDENDNTPLTVEPVYFPHVPENSLVGTHVVQIEAYDRDETPHNKLSFRISSGNPQGYFAIDSDTGLITTTDRRLDRETQDEHVLEVTVSDNGRPQLSSVTKIVVTVTDINDFDPIFSEQLYRAQIPEMDRQDTEVPLFQVIAVDRDTGPNAEIDYTIRQGKFNGRFKINPKTGMVSSQKNFTAQQQYDFVIQAADNGSPRRTKTTRVILDVVKLPSFSVNPPIIRNGNRIIRMNENDPIGERVTLVDAEDFDGDRLWYSIIDGNTDDCFMIKPEGEIILMQSLDRERKSSYNLTVGVTDGLNTVTTRIYIIVVDSNDNWPQFTEKMYLVEISENIPVGTEMIQIEATDQDEDKRLFYAFHSSSNPDSLSKFRIDSSRGIISTTEKLDQEACHQHELTVLVKDHGTPAHYNYTRVIIAVIDHNDHAPLFLSDKFEGLIYETSAVGSSVLQVLAVDRDNGKNAEIEFSIIAGNIGGTFEIDETLGIISVAKDLTMKSTTKYEYILTVKAVDHGEPPLSSTVPVHIVVTMANNAPPKFDKDEYSTEIKENLKTGSFVINVHALSKSTVYYEIIDGNKENYFTMNPNSGILSINRMIDYELIKFFNLTVQGTNLVHQFSQTTILVHILDVNDNAPYFMQKKFIGNISETDPIGSVIMTDNKKPLVVSAQDSDSELNALLQYEIIEKSAQKYFTMDINTGAIRTVSNLDHETVKKFKFHVQVMDSGKPQLTSETAATVVIYVNDVNDCPPLFEREGYNASIYLPTFKNVIVISLTAVDGDKEMKTVLKYSIVNGNIGNKFGIDGETGVITVKDEKHLQKRYVLTVQVSDGKYSSSTNVYVAINSAIHNGLIFSEEKYFANITENKSKIMTVVIVTVKGNSLDEHLHFKILNPNDMFTIGETSGAILTNGKAFDREVQDTYTLVVEVRSELEKNRVAQVPVHVNVLDENDNSPIFINLPYFAVVPVDAKENEVILKVEAIDKDIGDNGEVRYELSDGYKDYFRLNSKSGDLSLRKRLQEINKEFKLIVTAYDRGMEPRHTEANVTVRVISRSMPVFNQQYYNAVVPENIQPYSPVLSVHADSPEGRKLIYSITDGNFGEEFAVDFNAGVIYVVDELDYEARKFYQLKLQATDSVTGAHTDVLISITVEDVNDNVPEFSHTSYQVNVFENAYLGTVILELEAKDKDSGMNQLVHYTLESENDLTRDKFYIDPTKGMITVKGSLDREQMHRHHVLVTASDNGVPALNSSTHVWISVLDINDNPPRFEQPTYQCFLSELAKRGQFVTMVTAFDPDPSDQTKLRYAIVGGNDQQCFSISSATGKITLISLHKFTHQSAYTLNVSVSDGVFISFARVKIDVLSSNRHAPHFERSRYEVYFEENQPIGSTVTKLVAVDEDRGEFGRITYAIQSDVSRKIFRINSETGEILTKKILDRETQPFYDIPIVAVDGGGQSGYALMRVIISDVNDNPPQFKLGEYRANIPANMSIGTTIVQIQATDDDAPGINATVEYRIYETNISDTMTDLFGVNRETGEIVLKKSALALENQVYQFFIRARDYGHPTLESDIPVEIYIISPKEIPPKFEQRSSQFFLLENVAMGTMVTKLNARKNDPVRYFIASVIDEHQLDTFKIDEQGQLIVAGPLDREQQDIYSLTVCAKTESDPPLTACTDITIQVMDENDNDPEFESNPYRVSIAENVAEGSTVLKVVAHDRDLGHNADIRYTLATTTGNVLNVFAIDSATGWITVMVPLDREITPSYTFVVTATDNGNPPRSSSTRVNIEVQDYNDNPPVFTQEEFKAAVNEDALIGTVVISVSTTDADKGLNSRINYYITDGDKEGHFYIQHTGEIFVRKELDRESVASYRLQVTATDGTFVTHTKIFIEILDANDNPPTCNKVKYTENIFESFPISTFVLKIEASDKDEQRDSQFKYYLTGVGADHFTIDQAGRLRIATTLDREVQSRYHLTAHVQDREISDWGCSSEIEIVLMDVNDNAPEFTQDVYSFNVPEDTDVRMLIGKVHATDRDLNENRKIKYSFVSADHEKFHIDEKSGLITLKKYLDREQQALYNLTVKATDQGTPKLSSFAQLLIVVLDINDNPPEFVSRIYHASIVENSLPGTDVARVLATSRDSGINAEITYSIVGGNEQGKFSIHPKTGLISLVQSLDYEKTRDYFLTIQANDGGTPSLSNQASVNVSVIDANDNPPVFSQKTYSTAVLENVHPGFTVLQVAAVDLDSAPNNKITYYITNGDKDAHFNITSHSGVIAVQRSLDREKVTKYQLQIQAIDSGIPKMSGTAMVNIEVSDVNDNPPTFSSSNHTVFIPEDKPIGAVVLKFTVTDVDAIPNGAPFTFDIRSGNKGNKFRVAHDLTLRTASNFNHKMQDTYVLQVRVFDNGTPPLYSDTWVTVKIIEESIFPPVVFPLEVTVSSFMDEFPGGLLGQVKASDQDPYDELTFSLGPEYIHIFEINPVDGIVTAHAGLDAGRYELNVTVSDGKYNSYGTVTVDVHIITEQMLEHAVIIRFEDITPEDFIVTHVRQFKKTVRNILAIHTNAVEIISIQPASQLPRSKRDAHQDLDVAFAVQRGNAGYFQADQVRKALHESKTILEAALQIKVLKFHESLCSPDRCLKGECQDRIILDERKVISLTTDTQSFVSPQHYHRTECSCREGYGGERCDITINECAQDPCPPYMICIPDESQKKFFCSCPDDKTVLNCEDENQCNNCPKEKNPISFSGKSYARYTLMNTMDKYFTLSLLIRTGQPTGCVKYASGRVDYSILEIVNGIVQYRFNCGSGEGIVRVEHVHINDGKWHEIKLQRYGNTAELILDGKSSAQGSAPGHNDILNIDSNDIYFGAEVHPHPTISGYEDLRMGFVGCMDDIRIDRISLPLHKSNGNSVAVLRRFTNIAFHCILSPDLGVCGSQPCYNGGTCKMTDNSYVCDCHSRFTGKRCEVDTNPCASNPCLHGGTCSNLQNDFHCECAEGISGKRCEFGRHCNPNPCRHNGVCEEGSQGPICKCRGFQGELCQIDIDECLTNPCQNGGRCLNSIGSFVCSCEPNATGSLCDNLIPGSSITSSSMNITIEEIVGIIAVLVVILFVAIMFVVFKKIRAKRARQRRNDSLFEQPNKDIILKNKTQDDTKRCSKVSNLESTHLILPPRPASYTPSRHDSITALNNLDSVRNYGSAADDLETIPKINADFLQNITKNNTMSLTSNLPPPPPSDSDSLHKASWDVDHNLKESYPETKIHNDLKTNRPPHCHNIARNKAPDPNHDIATCVPERNFPIMDDMAGYHWDYSDLANSQNPLPNIAEFPTNEVPDSPSLHSNESNSHIDATTPLLDGDSEYVGDSEYNENEFDMDEQKQPISFDQLLSLNNIEYADDGDTSSLSHHNYQLHPNQYLPTYSVTTDTEYEDNGNLLQIDDDPPSYSFLPKTRDLMPPNLDTMSMSLGGYTSTNASFSDISENLCDIEDSEICSEIEPDEKRPSRSFSTVSTRV